MSIPEVSSDKQPQRASIPRWMAPIMWAVGFVIIHILFPWGISLLATRYGWVNGQPSSWNFLALILIGAGLLCIIWCSVLHFVAAPQGWEWERTPRYLLLKGPYKFTRNPLYLSEAVMWLGWALFYGSIAVFIALVLMGAFFAFILVPSEERALEARFGETYVQYKNGVPRWFGKIRR